MQIMFLSFVYICLNALILAELPTSNMTRENSLLMELHRYYCGGEFLCINVSYPEPNALWFPSTCCVPCSCLSKCGEHGNYFSSFRNNKAEENSRIGENATCNIQRSKQKLTTGDDKLQDGATLIETMKNETKNFSLCSHVRTDCVRPQSFHGLNRVLYSSAYEMIKTCPEGFKDEVKLDKCHARMDNGNIIDIIPVTSTRTGLTYANRYCAECNGIYEDNISKFLDWQPTLVGFDQDLRHRSLLRTEFIIKHIKDGSTGMGTNIHFIPKKAANPVGCEIYDVASCNQTGLLDMHNDSLENACENGTDLSIVEEIDQRRMLFKNIACLHCNTNTGFTGNIYLCDFYKKSAYYTKYSISFNLRSSVNGDNEDSSNSVRYLDGSQLRLLKQGMCHPGYAEIQGRCRQVICPRDHYMRNNQCVPLFDALSGLEIRIKIQVKPDQVITNNVAGEFEEKLEEMVNQSLRKSISMQVRDIFITYMPNKQRSVRIYYLVSVLLNNGSQRINFSQAVLETKTFYNLMKTEILPPLSNGESIMLEVEFAHKVKQSVGSLIDISNGRSIIMGASVQARKPLRPAFEISNIHWCYRTGFSMEEFSWNGIFTIHTNPLVSVYETETDFDHEDDNKLYTCINKFLSEVELEDVRQGQFHNTTERNLDIIHVYAEEGFGTLDRGMTLIIGLAGLAILILIFCKAKIAITGKRCLCHSANDEHTNS